MWYIAVCTVVTCLLYVSKYYEHDSSDFALYKEIENIKDIESVVKLLTKIAGSDETDTIVMKIVHVLECYLLSEDTLIRISKLHKEYGHDNGINGYAINLLWSCIVLKNSK